MYNWLMKVCDVGGCGRGHYAKGFCHMHYKRNQRTGAPGDAEAKRPWAEERTECAIDGCGQPIKVSGLCSTHEAAYRRGDIIMYTPEKTGRRGHSLVTWYGDKDNPYIKIWHPLHPNAWKNGYMSLHTFVMSQMLGRPLLPGENVHHKNGVRRDNRRANLELWVSSQPAGQRPEDLVVWAKEILERYDGIPSS